MGSTSSKPAAPSIPTPSISNQTLDRLIGDWTPTNISLRAGLLDCSVQPQNPLQHFWLFRERRRLSEQLGLAPEPTNEAFILQLAQQVARGELSTTSTPSPANTISHATPAPQLPPPAFLPPTKRVPVCSLLISFVHLFTYDISRV